ncbi:hypothetical protein ILUMI_21250 [Ignelater luminosus]|uniref:TGF-beta family profile domain-containing protein n=1 Tax=Ignelater luminosus TaxID=2038154 RepID=A0A8K0CFX7_IGNLU|nr:hypothetical protein ILUMI_21250 [Ignelater luminosus]
MVNKEAEKQQSTLLQLYYFVAGTLQMKDILHSFEENHLLVFDIPSSNEDETFFDAELRILTIVNNDVNSIVGVERFITISLYNEPLNKLHVLDERHVYHTDNTWLKFNMTDPVNQLLTNYTKQRFLKLIISVKAFLPFLDYNKDHFKLSLLPVTEDIEHNYPILLLSYMTSKESLHDREISKRKKRNVEEDYEEETNKIWDNEQQNKAQVKKIKRLKNTCKRKPLFVDFAEIQYDAWIVQPSGYEAYQCSGKCFYPVAEHLSPTKHAIVQALLHSVAPSRAVRSCCVPSKLGSISLLYIDEKGVLTYRYGYKDMVVAECGCR